MRLRVHHLVITALALVPALASSPALAGPREDQKKKATGTKKDDEAEKSSKWRGGKTDKAAGDADDTDAKDAKDAKKKGDKASKTDKADKSDKADDEDTKPAKKGDKADKSAKSTKDKHADKDKDEDDTKSHKASKTDDDDPKSHKKADKDDDKEPTFKAHKSDKDGGGSGGSSGGGGGGGDPDKKDKEDKPVDVDGLRQEYLQLKDELFKSRARANAVQSALYSTRVQIRLTYTTARYYNPAKAQIRLDGATVYEDASGAIGGDDGLRFDGYVAPGRHTITFRVEATGKDDTDFGSVTETQVAVKAVAGKDLMVAAKAKDGGDIAYEWKKKEHGSYGLGIDVAVKTAPGNGAPAAPAPAAKPAAPAAPAAPAGAKK